MSGNNSPLQLAINSFPEQTPLSEASFNRFAVSSLDALKIELRRSAHDLKLGDPRQDILLESDFKRMIKMSIKNAKLEIDQASTARRISKITDSTSMVSLRAFDVDGFSSAMFEKPELQDVFAIQRDEKMIVACLCDGAGLSKYSRDGATLVAQFLTHRATELLEYGLEDPKVTYSGPIDPKFIGQLHGELHWNFLNWAYRLGVSAHEAGMHVFTTTVQLLIITPKESTILAIGDGFYTHNSSHEALPTFVSRITFGRNTPEFFVMPFIKDEYRKGLEMDGHTFHIAGHWPTESIIRTGIFTDGASVCSDFQNKHGLNSTDWIQDRIDRNEKAISQKEQRSARQTILTWPDMDELWYTPPHEIIRNLSIANTAMNNGGGAAVFSDYATTPWPPFADDFAGIMVRRRKNL